MKIREIVNEGRGPKINHLELIIFPDINESEIRSYYTKLKQYISGVLGEDGNDSGMALSLSDAKIVFTAYGPENIFTKEKLRDIGIDMLAAYSSISNVMLERNEYKAKFMQFDSSKYPYMVSMEM